jgi:hypothetical protein
MPLSDFSVPVSLSPAPDSLPPPPRSVEASFRATWMRAGFLAGLVLGPLGTLWMGESSADNLRNLLAHGRTTTAQVVVRG